MKTSLLLLVLFISCNVNKEVKYDAAIKNPPDSVTSNSKAIINLIPGCYQMIIDKDSALMNLSVVDKKVSGSLQYKRFEKDSNAGNFEGLIENNKISGWYRFQSEGVISVRQVVFKISGGGISEGYGDIALRNDTAYFKYPQALNFEEIHFYKNIPCK